MNNLNNLVTFCNDSICYSGAYSPNHPKIQPGIVYGLAKGVADNLPLVRYNPHMHIHYAKSLLYWMTHYTSVSGILLFGASIFKCLFLADQFNNNENGDERDNKKKIDYSEKYFDKFDAIRNLPEAEKYQESKNDTRFNQVIDYTGKYGNVLMFYNPATEGFEYFADDKNIPFPYLETVSRKLGNTFHCTDKIVDRRNVVQNKQSENTLKSETIVSSNLAKSANLKKTVSKANKFIYVGKFSSMNPLQSVQYDEASPSKKSIRSKFTYKEYMESLQMT